MTDATPNLDDAKKSGGKIIGDAADAAGDKAAELRRAFDERAAAAGDKAAELRRAFDERAAAARDWASDQGDVLRDTVQTRPFISVGISAGSAFAAGLVIGVLLTRR